MNRNALLLKLRSSKGGPIPLPKRIVETPDNITNDKFNPDVKAKYLEENGDRRKDIKPSNFKLPQVIKEDKKINVDLNKIEQDREKLPPVSKAKRNIQSVSEKSIETQSEQKENTSQYYKKEQERLEQEKTDVEDILNQY